MTKYIEKSFSVHGLENAHQSEIYSKLEGLEVFHDVSDAEVDSFSSLIYLQNVTDSHTKKHAAPFIRNKKIKPVSGSVFSINDSDRHFIVFSDWGNGHIPPPKSSVIEIVKSISLFYSSGVKFLSQSLSRLESSSSPIFSNNYLVFFELVCEFSDGG